MPTQRDTLQNQINGLFSKFEQLQTENAKNGIADRFTQATIEEMKFKIPESFEFEDGWKEKVMGLSNPIRIPMEHLFFAEFGSLGLSPKDLEKVNKAFLHATKGTVAEENQWPKNNTNVKAIQIEAAFNFVNIAAKVASLKASDQVHGSLIFLRNFAELRTGTRNYTVEEAIHWALREKPTNFSEVKDWYLRRNHGGEIRDRRNEYKELKIRPSQCLQQFMEVIALKRYRLPRDDQGSVDDMFAKIEISRTSHKWDTYEMSLLELIANRRAMKRTQGEELDETDWHDVYRRARDNNDQYAIYGKNNGEPGSKKKGKARGTKRGSPEKVHNPETNSETEKPPKKKYKHYCEYGCGYNNTHPSEKCYRKKKFLREKEKEKQNQATTASVETVQTVATIQDGIDRKAQSAE